VPVTNIEEIPRQKSQLEILEELLETKQQAEHQQQIMWAMAE